MLKPRPVHERVHDHVRNSNVTYEQIAAETGWKYQRVYRLLAGKTELSAEDMEKIAAVLKKSVDELYQDPEAKAS